MQEEVAQVKGIIVFDDGGMNQASIGLDNIQVDPDLFGAFIAAIQAYAKRYVGSEMREVTYSNVRLMVGRAGPYHVVTLHSIDDVDADWNHSATLNVLETEDYVLDDEHLSILNELLTGEVLSPHEVETGIDTLTSIKGQ
jgi:hypothetical protein